MEAFSTTLFKLLFMHILNIQMVSSGMYHGSPYSGTFFFQPYSPNWLVTQKEDKRALQYLRGPTHDSRAEFDEIKPVVEENFSDTFTSDLLHYLRKKQTEDCSLNRVAFRICCINRYYSC